MTEPCSHPDHEHADGPGLVRIVPISAIDAGTAMQRRSVFRVGLTVAAALAAVATTASSCGGGSSSTPPSASYTPAPYTPPPYTPPPTTTSATPTTTETPDDNAPSGGGTGGSGGRGGGDTLTQPCLPTPIPPGYTCTCNCVPG